MCSKFVYVVIKKISNMNSFVNHKFHLSLRHVVIPQKYVSIIPKHHLMTETEWRNVGIQQSPGWVHYLFHAPGRIVL